MFVSKNMLSVKYKMLCIFLKKFVYYVLNILECVFDQFGLKSIRLIASYVELGLKE